MCVLCVEHRFPWTCADETKGSVDTRNLLSGVRPGREAKVPGAAVSAEAALQLCYLVYTSGTGGWQKETAGEVQSRPHCSKAVSEPW